MTEVYAIVPVREFRNTKLRLSAVLTESERASLTGALLKHVISVLLRSKKITAVIVVSTDPREVASALGPLEKIRIIQESKFHGGVNSAVNDGIEQVRFQKEKDPMILVLPSDLPLLTRDSVDNAIDLLDKYDLVINPSIKKDGTNLLEFRLSNLIRLYYDQDSYTNHVREAQSRKLDFLMIEWKEFSFDVDDPEDLNELNNKFKTESVASLIKQLEINSIGL